MCSYNITLNDSLIEKVRPSFADDKALECWLQQQMEEFLLNLYLQQMAGKKEAQSAVTPPCQYTEEEAIQRILKATADVDAGRDLMTVEEFETLVASW